jgi:hypothetical protein
VDHSTVVALYCCLTAVSVLAACLLVAWVRSDKRLEASEARGELWRTKCQIAQGELARLDPADPSRRQTVAWRVG